MERRFDAPKPTTFNFNADDQRRMVRLCQDVAAFIVTRQGTEPLEAGVIALGLANMARDFLSLYPDAFRDKLIKEINRQIFSQAPSPDGPRLITLH